METDWLLPEAGGIIGAALHCARRKVFLATASPGDRAMPETPEDEDVEPADDLSMILTFTQMLLESPDQEAAVRFAVEHDWLDSDGQPTAGGSMLARALRQQKGTRSVFHVW